MSELRISLAVAHAPWAKGRPEALRALLTQLNAEEPAAYKLFDEKAPNHVWSGEMWQWAASQEVDWCLFLQDDTEVCPKFWERLRYQLDDAHWEGQPVVGLHVAHPAARAVFNAGGSKCKTTDALVGVAYAVRRQELAEFLVWRSSCLEEGAIEAISEDTLLALWAAVTECGVLHPLPALADHNVAIPSTYGNEAHANRVSSVKWGKASEFSYLFWETLALGRFYDSTPHLAKKWVKDFPEAQFQELLADTGVEEKRKLYHITKACMPKSDYRLFIATPTREGVSTHYALSVWRLMKDERLGDASLSFEVVDVRQQSADVVRVRSRLMAHFLFNTDATHMLFLDADIEVTPNVIMGMLNTGKDFIASPYPRRDMIDLHRVRGNPTIIPEAVAYKYSVRFIGDELNVSPEGVAEVMSVPLGCAIISRVAAMKMWDAYPQLEFAEEGVGPARAVFQLVLSDKGLYSEDYSFCYRWREQGGSVYLYLGEGSPVNHHGGHMYKGHVGAFGLERQ